MDIQASNHVGKEKGRKAYYPFQTSTSAHMINHNTALRISSSLNKEILFCSIVYFFYKK